MQAAPGRSWRPIALAAADSLKIDQDGRTPRDPSARSMKIDQDGRDRHGPQAAHERGRNAAAPRL
jgi:hypothetical protein